MIKQKYYILGTLALLCLLGTGYYAWTLYDAHRKQVAEWNEGAKAAFEEALWMEVNKRAEVPILHTSSGEHGMTTLNARIPDSVSVMTVGGFRKYKIDRNKYDRSLVKETKTRAGLSTLFSKYPLSVDTLMMCWNSLLHAKQISVNNRIRYVYTDWNLQNDTVCSVSDNHLSLDSLTVKYLGFRCEHEITAYISYPYWLLSLSFAEYFLLLLPWVLFGLVVTFYSSLKAFFRCKFVKEKLVEKQVHVADVPIGKAVIYKLPDGSLFDLFARTITRGDSVYTIPPQSSLLLKLFLRKESHRLTTEEIDKGLWDGDGSVDKIHKAIQRLRAELKKVSSDLVIRNVNGDYELKNAHSIE